jgi:MFS family permease
MCKPVIGGICIWLAIHKVSPPRAINVSPVVGYFSDRASSRKLHFLFGLFALILSTTLIAVSRVYWILLVARVLQGCSSAVVWTVGMAVLAETLPTEQLGVTMGTVGSVVSLGMVSSPVLGGTIFHAFGYHAVFWTLGGILLVDVFLRLIMIERKDAEEWSVGVTAEPEANENTALLNNPPQVKSPSLRSLFLVSHQRSC